MPKQPDGTYVLPRDWEQDAANGINIEPDLHMEVDTDLGQALTDSLDRQGRGGMQADLAMGGNKLTGLAAGSNATDGVNITQVQNEVYQTATETGTANAYVIALTPAITAYTTGLTVKFVATNANTGASTLQVNGLTPAPALQWHSKDLVAGTITDGAIVEAIYTGSVFELLNPPAVLPIAYGGTGAKTVEDAQTNLGIGLDQKNRLMNSTAPFVNEYPAAAGVNVASNSYAINRWRFAKNGAGEVNIGVVNDGTVDWIELDVATADATIDANDIYIIGQRIEANNIADFNLGTANAATVTLSFKHNIIPAGTYGVGFQNAASNRSYVATFTQAVSGADEESQITLTLDTTGTWATGNAAGLKVDFCMAAGTTYQTTADSWQPGNFSTTSAQTNLMASTANRFRVRDIAINIGTAATPKTQDYGQKLRDCRRYYQPVPIADKIYIPTFGVIVNANLLSLPYKADVPMRATPTIQTSGTATDYQIALYNGSGSVNCTSVPALSTAFNNEGGYIDFTSTAHGIALGSSGQGRSAGDALLALEAEFS